MQDHKWVVWGWGVGGVGGGGRGGLLIIAKYSNIDKIICWLLYNLENHTPIITFAPAEHIQCASADWA